MDNVRPILDQVNIVSKDVAASIEFYRRLGLNIPETRVWRTPSGIHHVNSGRQGGGESPDLDLDSTAFAQIWNTGWKGRADLGGRIVIGFKLPTRDAVDALYRDMTTAGHRGLQPPWDAFWGSRYAVIEDPDGIAVGLMSPIEPARKTPPPDV
jgi:catechol 2,3-dioxygenase-like lactoylglutathione lyase family enzyme